jgi:hypothetical protein
MRASVFAWGWPAAKGRWKSACRGLAAELFAERPELARVGCRFAKVTSPSAEAVLAGDPPSEKWVLAREVARSEVVPP